MLEINNSKIWNIEFEEMQSTRNALVNVRLPHLRWVAPGKSRLCNVTYYYDLASNEDCLDCECDSNASSTEEQKGMHSYTSNLKLKLPIPKHIQKKTQHVLILPKKVRKCYDMF